jgi:ribosome-associated translation inhibitor RaiA
MLIPPQVTFHGLAHSSKLKSDVLGRIAWLEKFYQGLDSCRVVVEVPHRHRRNGSHVEVTIELAVRKGDEIVIRHEPSLHGALKDAEAVEHPKESDVDSAHRHARVAIHDAFDAARRRLQDFARRQRGAVKTHAGGQRGH